MVDLVDTMSKFEINQQVRIVTITEDVPANYRPMYLSTIGKIGTITRISYTGIWYGVTFEPEFMKAIGKRYLSYAENELEAVP